MLGPILQDVLLERDVEILNATDHENYLPGRLIIVEQLIQLLFVEDVAVNVYQMRNHK